MSAGATTAGGTDPTLHLPRMLCLHGGGTNARIFRAQCRVLSRALEGRFRLAYAEGPHASAAGPDVATVYAGDGPFKRWLRWLPAHEALGEGAAVRAIDGAVRDAMAADDARGADGPWVALLGFSQGAKLAASLLFRAQRRADRRAADAGQRREEEEDDGVYDAWRFAVILAGRAPLVNLEPALFASSLLSSPSETGLTAPPDLMEMAAGAHVLRLPSIHVHGLADPGLGLHQDLFEQYTDPATARLVQWDGGHRVVLKSTDVQPVVDAIIAVAKETGVL
ncbi:putative citrinin biosynthesis oxydoreductase [Rosellinia necatrix]|uniref:Putative citrinin biosynthesis oxydoreductase n=1 Tax=Rosellinia necatrix TaxID=77044 RepID=A0A1S7UNN1_ROSNE|nr:putative citrinin biosynthesis oxydoreductase [Rosellinia necatrix]